MKKLLTGLIFLIGLFVSAQTPNISYTSQNVYLPVFETLISPNGFITGSNSATTISPTNTVMV